MLYVGIWHIWKYTCDVKIWLKGLWEYCVHFKCASWHIVTSECTALLGQKSDFWGVSDSSFSSCTAPTCHDLFPKLSPIQTLPHPFGWVYTVKNGFSYPTKGQEGWDRPRKDVMNRHQGKALSEGCRERKKARMVVSSREKINNNQELSESDH